MDADNIFLQPIIDMAIIFLGQFQEFLVDLALVPVGQQFKLSQTAALKIKARIGEGFRYSGKFSLLRLLERTDMVKNA